MFDDHAVPTDTKLEPRPRAPVGYLQWGCQAENMAKAYALSYGKEYEAPLLKYLRHLQALYEKDDHHWTFTFIADAWEKLFWRQTEE
eukprot:3540530-Heterocapsa_arctica.AAC.1